MILYSTLSLNNVWAMLTKILYADGKQYKSISELKEGLMLACQSIQSQVINPYIDSMSDRIFDCICKKGSYTKY